MYTLTRYALIFFISITTLSVSIITHAAAPTLSPSGWNAGWKFQEIFTNIIWTWPCAVDHVITGFDPTPGGNYGRANCTLFQTLLGSIFSSSTGWPGQAVVWFNPDGTLKYALMSDTNWKNSAGNISYTGGNVGIGTNNPLYKLSVYTPAGGNWIGRFASPDGAINIWPANGGWSHIYADNVDRPFIFNTDIFSINGTFSSYNGSLTLGTSNGWPISTPRLTILHPNGNVGIWTNTPNAKLQVDGGPNMTAGYNRNTTFYANHPTVQFKWISDTNHSGFIWYDAQSTSEALRFWVGWTTDDIGNAILAMSIRNNGNVGIGTTTPDKLLHVVSNNPTNNGNQWQIVMENSSPTGNAAMNIRVAGPNMAGIQFSQWAWATTLTGAVFGYYMWTAGVPTGFQFVTRVNGVQETKVLIKDNGNVGIWTTAPWAKLTLVGNAGFDPLQLSDGARSFRIWPSVGVAGGFQIYDDQAAAVRMRIQDDGNVGIWTDTPTAKLDVNGDLAIRGNVRLSPATAQANRVLTATDATGNSEWRAPTVPWSGITGKPSLFTYDGWINNPGYDANTIAWNRSGFSYSNNAPHTWPLTHFDASWYGLEFSADYNGWGEWISFRTRNGDSSTWNLWNRLITPDTIASYAPGLTGAGASGTWWINISGNAATATTAASSLRAISAWSYGSTEVYGSNNGWSGIRFNTPNSVFMVRDSDNYSGLYKSNNTWVWAFDPNGSLISGTVPWSGITEKPTTVSSWTNDSNYITNNNANYLVTAWNGNAICFWADCTNYTISMGNGSLYTYGSVNDYSIKMQMNAWSAGRGFTWGRQGVAPIASLNSTSGDFQTAGNVTAGGTIYANGGISDSAGARMDAGWGWLRTYGNTGWYNGTYAGGLYMQDSTWIRAFNDKSLWLWAGILGSNGGLSVGYGGTTPPSWGAIIAGNVGIGTTTPWAKLDVAGTTKTTTLQITGGTPGVGKVLTSDASGLATWGTPSGGWGWLGGYTNLAPMPRFFDTPGWNNPWWQETWTNTIFLKKKCDSGAVVFRVTGREAWDWPVEWTAYTFDSSNLNAKIQVYNGGDNRLYINVGWIIDAGKLYIDGISASWLDYSHSVGWVQLDVRCSDATYSSPVPICGDGIAELWETCDDRVNNGSCGYCNPGCWSWWYCDPPPAG